MHTKWDESAKYRKAELSYQYMATKGNVPEDIKNELMILYELENEDDLKRFGEGLKWCTKLIYENDPIGLVPLNVPEEEYDCEARLILRELSIRGNPTLKEINEVVHEIFVLQFTFDSAGQNDRICYQNISKELYENKNFWQNK